MLKTYKILKKGEFCFAQSLEDPDAKDIIFSLIQDSFGIESLSILAINSEEALEQYHMGKEMLINQ